MGCEPKQVFGADESTSPGATCSEVFQVRDRLRSKNEIFKLTAIYAR